MNSVHVQEIEERAVIGNVEVAKKTMIAASDDEMRMPPEFLFHTNALNVRGLTDFWI